MVAIPMLLSPQYIATKKRIDCLLDKKIIKRYDDISDQKQENFSINHMWNIKSMPLHHNKKYQNKMILSDRFPDPERFQR